MHAFSPDKQVVKMVFPYMEMAVPPNDVILKGYHGKMLASPG